MSAFHVDAEHLQAVAQTAIATTHQISADTQALLNQLTGLQSAWTGSASLAFQDTLAQWQATQKVVEASLANIQQALAAAASQYVEVEQANLRLFGR